MKNRLDVILAGKGLAASRTAAQALIKEGSVSVNGTCITRPSELFDDETDHFSVDSGSRLLKYAGRGGLKLETAINAFGIELNGLICLDIGASTGGFTDCMLQNGASKVYAVDVGKGQLAERLLADSRVISLEETDIRKAGKTEIPETVDFISIDVSFISLKLILPEIKRFAADNAHCAALIKPQFEVGRKKTGKSGVVREPKLHKAVVEDICAFAEGLGFRDIRTVPSAIDGGDGNKEFLMYFKVF